MKPSTWPSDPTRLWALRLLYLVLILCVLGMFVLRFLLDEKHSTSVPMAGFWATLGVMQWFFPEMSRLSKRGRRLFAVFLWAFSAFILFS